MFKRLEQWWANTKIKWQKTKSEYVRIKDNWKLVWAEVKSFHKEEWANYWSFRIFCGVTVVYVMYFSAKFQVVGVYMSFVGYMMFFMLRFGEYLNKKERKQAREIFNTLEEVIQKYQERVLDLKSMADVLELQNTVKEVRIKQAEMRADKASGKPVLTLVKEEAQPEVANGGN